MVIKYIRKLLGRRKVEPAEAQKPPLDLQARPRQPEVHHRPIPVNLIDPEATKIIKRLRRFGHTAYIVGGGVRDLLLNRTPKDFDIGTSARPNEVRKLFRNCRIIGRRFRLAHIFFHDKIIEVATFRSNQPEDLAAAEEAETAAATLAGASGAAEPRGAAARDTAPREEGDLLIRSDNVFGTPETDALRRDFTLNALFYDIETGNVIDYVGGIADLDAHLLRMIGDPEVRLREDPIRILRAIRLAGRLGFTIHADTLQAIRRHKADVTRAAPPRILEDLLRMFRKGGAEKALSMLHELGVDQVVMPEITASARPGDFEFQLKALHSLDLATARGTEFSNATLLALLFYPFVRHALDTSEPDGSPKIFTAIDKSIGGFEQRLIVPKRDRDRIRQILVSQRRFLPASASQGKRPSSGSFISKPFFPEAFDLFDIITSATGEHREEVKRWKARITSVAAATDGASLGPEIPALDGNAREDGRGPGGKRRRRGGRGRERGGERMAASGSGAGRAAGHQGRGHERGGGQPRGGGKGHAGEARDSAGPALHSEPFIIPDLAPGENPYGDAIMVPIPAGGSGRSGPGGAPRRGGSSSHGGEHRHGRGAADPAAGADHAALTSRDRDPALDEGGSLSPARPDSDGSGPAASGSGRKRRRRRGGRRRQGNGEAGGGGSQGAPPATEL